MKKLLRRLSKVADSSSQYSLLRSSAFRKRSGGVPEGHLPVYVGEEMERFVVNAELLNHPIFVRLLNKSAQEYGYEQKGVLRIPCHVFLFERVLEALRHGCDVQDLLDSLTDDL
ncbi:auxin-responsive protein SAUR71-like [Andrographis paniculata]|uniref:auxin-responsive protein SAUR71-like n=1 Tax=Andrographis paniculata TaxID=175694 RepID=UPI0021E72960|nr:auxin-responsive protein SAUR71-like [Andrographis paniculata]